jgi:iron-sulfur cluster assembly protein
MITVTDEARDKAIALREAEGQPESAVLRVGVQGGGCSGFQYALGFDGPPQPGDAVAQVHGITVVVDRFSLPYLEGAGIDYVDGLMGQGFTVNNPNAVASCGCGKSFTGADADPSAAPAGPDGCASGCSA